MTCSPEAIRTSPPYLPSHPPHPNKSIAIGATHSLANYMQSALECVPKIFTQRFHSISALQTSLSAPARLSSNIPVQRSRTQQQSIKQRCGGKAAKIGWLGARSLTRRFTIEPK
ncbi:hypothetical protein Tcan_06138 [Toxocara canis]|uniref:Uncharacterized protein n=1 Tax=Toxocara canis TaxID=6265 RepID=A0A0B2V129_TOXCA|nr:hypothetical protein Tcan_06138 [Toxocara canis]